MRAILIVFVGHIAAFSGTTQSLESHGTLKLNNTTNRLRADEYDENIAKQMLAMSAATYSVNDPMPCVQRTFGDTDQWKLLQVINNVVCDRFGGHCSGFVIVSTVRQQVIVSFRGTDTFAQLLTESVESLGQFVPLRSSANETIGLVDEYFSNALDLLWTQMMQQTMQNVDYEQFTFYYTGHSLGAALASLAAAKGVYDGYHKSNMTRLITFGQPRVGDFTYSCNHNRLVPYSYRVVHRADIVPHLPLCKKSNGICEQSVGVPYHHGVEVWYNNDMSTGAAFVVCSADGEDAQCSNSLRETEIAIEGILDHPIYFGRAIATFCNQTEINDTPTTTAIASSVVPKALVCLIVYLSVYI